MNNIKVENISCSLETIEMLKCVIPIGRENAIHQQELADKLGVTPSMVKKMVQGARKIGIAICSGTQGYWIAKDDAEKQAFVNLLKKQAITRFSTITPINKELAKINGQQELDIGGEKNDTL